MCAPDITKLDCQSHLPQIGLTADPKVKTHELHLPPIGLTADPKVKTHEFLVITNGSL